MSTFTALVRRETWESSAFWIVPGVFALLLVVGAVFGMVSLWQFADPADVRFGLDSVFAMDAGERRGTLAALLVGMAIPFNMFLVGVIFFYSLDCLYGERRDRSVLFWKSMPVSDLQTVLSKLAMALLAGPAMALAVIVAFHVVSMLFAAGVALWAGTDGWYVPLDPLALLTAWATLAWMLLAQSLVYLPIVAWLMLASAWAKRAPFLWAVVPPVFVIVVEGWARGFDGRTVLGSWLVERISHGLPLALNIDGGRHGGLRVGHGGVVEAGGSIDVRFDLLWSGLLWEGVAIAVVLLAATVWLRRYRAEAE